MSSLSDLLSKATPGPWRTNEDWNEYGGLEPGEGNWVWPHGAYSNNPVDNELMALAPVLAQAAVACDRYINWHKEWVVPTEEIPDQNVALKVARDALLSLRAAAGGEQ
jgi:hypothetical protein